MIRARARPPRHSGIGVHQLANRQHIAFWTGVLPSRVNALRGPVFGSAVVALSRKADLAVIELARTRHLLRVIHSTILGVQSPSGNVTGRVGSAPELTAHPTPRQSVMRAAFGGAAGMTNYRAKAEISC